MNFQTSGPVMNLKLELSCSRNDFMKILRKVPFYGRFYESYLSREIAKEDQSKWNLPYVLPLDVVVCRL